MIHDDYIHIKPLGDSALIVQLADVVSEEGHEKVMEFIQAVENDPFEGFLEAVPSYNNVTIFYNPVQVYLKCKRNQTVFAIVCTHVNKYIRNKRMSIKETSRVVEIPVLYGGEYGPDLAYVAKINDLSEEEVIRIHSSNDYLVYMIGFAPGFPFLGGIDERIEAPRKDSPRAAVRAGSVGIAGKQTGIYSLETPGGWQIIGHTPVELFLPESDPPTLLLPGDRLQFVSVAHEEYKEHKSRLGK